MLSFEGEENKLVFELENSRPVELVDLSRSLASVANQYRRFVIREELHGESEAKLYVKEVRDGSIIIELFSYVQAHHDQIVPIVKSSKSVIEFGLFLKKTFSELSRGQAPTADLKKKDISDLVTILEPAAKDPDSKLSIHADHGATVNVTINLSNSDANTIQNQSTKLIGSMRETDKEEYFKRAFYWQTASRGRPTRTDKGVIESIEDRAVPVIFETDDIKQKMVEGKDHPFLTTYIVDVELIILRGITKAYKITRLRDIIEDDDEES